MWYKRKLLNVTGGGRLSLLELIVNLRMLTKLTVCGVVLLTLPFASRLNAQNLTLEGQTGGFLTPTAYVVYTAKDHFFSHPAVGYHFINANSVIGDVHTFSIEEGFGNRAEVGYTRSVHWTGDSTSFSNLSRPSGRRSSPRMRSRTRTRYASRSPSTAR